MLLADHDPPQRRRCVMICPSGANALDRRRSRRLRKRFQPQNHLRLKTNFSRAFKSMTPVQICCEKYSAWRSAKINRILLASRLVQRGVSRSSRTWRRAAVDARDRSILLNADERSPRGRPSPVWSWRPDAGAKFLERATRALGVTGAKEPGPRGERGVSR
jgi:hypothetical protein